LIINWGRNTGHASLLSGKAIIDHDARKVVEGKSMAKKNSQKAA